MRGSSWSGRLVPGPGIASPGTSAASDGAIGRTAIGPSRGHTPYLVDDDSSARRRLVQRLVQSFRRCRKRAREQAGAEIQNKRVRKGSAGVRCYRLKQAPLDANSVYF